MKAAILCPGPSLLETWRDEPGVLKIGVNRSALAFDCDWWAAIDIPLLMEVGGQVRGSPKLFTARDSRRPLTREHPKWDGRSHLFAEDVFYFCHPTESGIGWTIFTAPAALMLAAHLGAKSIDVYGADWTDEPDFDGVRAEGANRSAERWARERVVWEKTAEWLADRGVSVERVLAAAFRE